MSDETKQQCPQCEKWQQVSGLNTPEELDKIMDNVLAKNLAPIQPLLDAMEDAPSGGPRCPACGESLALDGNPPTPSGCSNEECAAFAYARESQPSPAVAPNTFKLLGPELDGAIPCHCGMGLIPEGYTQRCYKKTSGVHWYWQTHRKDQCLLELPNKRCWCGLLRHEHVDGHNDRVVMKETR